MTESAAAAGTEQGAGNTANTQTSTNTTNTGTTNTTAAPANDVWYSEADQVTADDIKYMESKGWKGKDAPSKIFKSYQNAEKLISQIKGDPDRIIVMPKDMTNAEEVAAFRAKLGVPSDAKGYELENIESPFMTEFADVMLKTGASKDTAKAMMDWAKTVKEKSEKMEAETFTQESEKQFGEFQKETGSKFQEKIQAGKTAIAMFPSLKEKSGQLEKALGTKDFLSLMADIGSKLGEATSAGAVPGNTSGGMTPDQAKQQIQLMQADRNKTADLMDSGRPGHQATRAEWDRLHKVAYPG